MRKGRCYGVFCRGTRLGLLLWCPVERRQIMDDFGTRQTEQSKAHRLAIRQSCNKSADTANSDKVPPALTLHTSTLTYNQIHGLFRPFDP